MEDDYIVEEFSEDEYNSSSSEDDDIQSFIKKQCGLIEVEDDFETEVDKVMTAHLEKLHPPQPDEASGSSVTTTTAKAAAAMKQAKINDELLYDPDMDDEDEKWVNDKRRSYIFPSASGNTSNNTLKPKPLPNSDAVLNCPACLCLLCMDCQRHDIYKSQYRAMFVSNCNIVESETLKYPKKKKKFRKRTDETSSIEYEIYNPVRCSMCNTEVAVYDAEEMYHFFNVLASY